MAIPHRARWVVFALLLAVGCTSAAPSDVRPATSGSPPAPSRSATPSESPEHRPSEVVAIRPPRGGSFLVRGSYPRVRSRCKHPEQPSLKARYPGKLSIRRSEDGTLAVMVTVPFERYLEGIAEVPPSWPSAALQAQAVAARSYALASTGWSGPQGGKLPTPICATASCQVYGGIPVPRQPNVGRWYRAVRRTAGLVLLYGDRPADTVYFSTSNGHTYGNDQVFGSAPLPYLRPVAEHDDGASPESRWRVTLPFRDLTTFLRAADLWPKGKTISGLARHGSTVVIHGDETRRTLDESAFRDDVNEWAPCFRPRRYPPPSRQGPPLPVTVPSGWFRVATSHAAAVLTGRGWGHGVGMVQWGAYGKARRGWSAAQILAYYYGGLRPQRYPEPGLIRVEVAAGLEALSVVPSGPGAKLDGRRVGTGRIRVVGGRRIVIRR